MERKVNATIEWQWPNLMGSVQPVMCTVYLIRVVKESGRLHMIPSRSYIPGVNDPFLIRDIVHDSMMGRPGTWILNAFLLRR